jgi:hypothetical protein
MEKIEPISELTQPVKNMLDAIAFIGVCHFEVIENNGLFYFLDLNLRLGGTTGKAYKLGYNEFYELIKIHKIVSEKVPNKIHGDSVTVVSKVALIKALVSVLRGTWKQTDYPHRKKAQLMKLILKELIMGSDELYSVEDYKVSLFFLLDYFMRALEMIKIK